MESSVQFIFVFCGSLSDEYGCPCSTCKLCGNDAHYGYDCPSQVLFDQIQSPQYSVVHQSPQETDMEMLQAREDLMEAIQVFLKKYDHIPPKEKCMALALAEERFLKVKKAFEEEQSKKLKPRIIKTELLAEEQAATINSLYQNPNLLQSFIYQDDDNDDDDYDEESILSMNTDILDTTEDIGLVTMAMDLERIISLLCFLEYEHSILDEWRLVELFDPLSLVLETLLPFSSEIEDKVFNLGILVLKEEKSPQLLSHQGFKVFKITHNFLNEARRS
ncbi:hypothetical protein Tco_0880589 [Tanacetum coccineum]